MVVGALLGPEGPDLGNQGLRVGPLLGLTRDQRSTDLTQV